MRKPCSADRTIRLWDPAAGKEVAVLRGHEKKVEWLSYSPDGQRICSLDGETGRLWDATTGQAIAVLGGPVKRLNVLFTPDSRRLVIGLDNKVCLMIPPNRPCQVRRRYRRPAHGHVASEGNRNRNLARGGAL